MAEERGIRDMREPVPNPCATEDAAETGRRHRHGIGRFAALAVLSALADAALLSVFATGVLSVAAAALVNVALATLVGIVAVRIADDRTCAVLLASGLAVMGPFGAAGALVLVLGEALAPREDRQLDDWYRQLAGIAQTSAARSLHEDIVEDRAYRPYGLPAPFPVVLAEGSVGDRQTVLGLLVKERRPVPEALLASALRSRDVAVRASAAAAVSRIRENAARAAGSPGHVA